jgi:broad specificity phosphatase PhoE
MSARIILARHGESTVNVIQLASDDFENSPLTALGISQAQRLMLQVRDEGLVHVYTSPVQRARETGAIVADVLQLPISIELGLEEIRIGIHEGEVGPVSTIRGAMDFHRWLAEEDLSHGYVGGETGRQVAERASVALRAIAARHDGDTVLVISHGGTIAMTVPSMSDNVRLRSLYSRQLHNCSTVIVEADGQNWTCLEWMGVAPDRFLGESVA